MSESNPNPAAGDDLGEKVDQGIRAGEFDNQQIREAAEAAKNDPTIQAALDARRKKKEAEGDD